MNDVVDQSEAGSRGISLGEFLAMGDYGFYVWFAYGVTLLGLLSLFVWSWFGAHAREAELEQVRKWSRAERKAPAPAVSEDDATPENEPYVGVAHKATAGGQGNE